MSELKPFDKFKAWVERYQIGPSMNDKFFAERLKIDVPKLYSGRDGSVGDGWVEKILEPLAVDLIAMGWDRDLHQVKEKFGGLRFYVGSSTKEMNERIHRAEDESYKICETCGEPGKRCAPTGYWILTLCSKCEADRAAGARKLREEWEKK